MIIIKFQGGLGNQMFQYALFKRFQCLGREVKADLSFYDENTAHNGFELERIFGLSLPKASKEEIERLKDTNKFLRRYRRFFNIGWKKTDVQQVLFDYKDDIFKLDDAYLDGYWQSEKFFEPIIPGIKEDFKINLEDENNKGMAALIESSNSVSIHIRGTDFEKDKLLGGISTADYYKKAIELLRTKVDNPVFFVFSDDFEYAKKIINEPVVDMNKGNDSYKDLILMSLCKHNIMANSSFSWWGAWLNRNPNKMVVCPSKWVNLKRLDSLDIIPDGWIRYK